MSEGKRYRIEDIIEKRKDRWNNGCPAKGIAPHSAENDAKIVQFAVQSLLTSREEMVKVREHPQLLIEAVFTIVNKQMETVPFFLNEVQQDIVRQIERFGGDKAHPFFILKGRQQGVTSFVTAYQLACCITRKNFMGETIAHRDIDTKAIFADKARAVYRRLPEALHPTEGKQNESEMSFEKLGSSWRCDTATESIGRSRTLAFVHLSEVAFFTRRLSVLESALNPAITKNAIVIYETTANGFNEAKAKWDSGVCHNLFYEWWVTSEYRSEHVEVLNEVEDGWLADRLKWLREEKHLDEQQLAWYVEQYNGYIDKAMLRQEFPCTPEEAFLFSGASFFDAELVTNAMNKALAHPKLSRRGYFSYRAVEEALTDYKGDKVGGQWVLKDIKWVDDPNGFIKIHEEPRVHKNDGGSVDGQCPYVIGGDTSGDGGDYWTGKVIDNITKRTVATLRVKNIDSDRYVEQLMCLGYLFHKALISIEVNFSDYPMMVLTKKYNYPNVYMRERYDKTYEERTREAGFRTTEATKKVATDNLLVVFREFPDIEPDPETLHEMSVFVVKEGGHREAVEGEHDDLVMALAIAHISANQQMSTWLPVNVKDLLKEWVEKNFTNPDWVPIEKATAQPSGTNYMTWDDL